MLTPTKSKNIFILVGADKGGVGKTTLARVIVDYLNTAQVPLKAFDSEGVLKRFFTNAEVVSLGKSLDQERIIDHLGDQRVTLIDIRAGELSPVLRLFKTIGFKHGEEAHLVVFHVLGNSIASLDEIKVTAEMLANGGGDHVMVKNHLNSGNFFEWDDATYEKYVKSASPTALIEIDTLDASAAERADGSNQPFTSFIVDPKNSRLMRGHVRNWYEDCVAKLDKVGLKALTSQP